MDISWLKDESNGNNGSELEPEDVLGEIFIQLQTAFDALNELAEVLNNGIIKANKDVDDMEN